MQREASQTISFRQNLVLASSILLLLTIVVIECDRSTSARRLSSSNNNRGSFKSTCGSAEQVSERVGKCLDGIFELVEGKIANPKGDDDLVSVCSRFNSTERCVRVIAKDCLTGLHKTATSAVASATRRFRTQECKSPASRGRYIDPLKCAIKRGQFMTGVLRNHTGIVQGIRDLDITPEEKLIKTCCLLINLDREIERSFNAECPKSTPLVLGIVHAMTDDARSTLCVSPKCQGALDSVVRSKYKPPQNFVEPIMQILFMLNTD